MKQIKNSELLIVQSNDLQISQVYCEIERLDKTNPTNPNGMYVNLIFNIMNILFIKELLSLKEKKTILFYFTYCLFLFIMISNHSSIHNSILLVYKAF